MLSICYDLTTYLPTTYPIPLGYEKGLRAACYHLELSETIERKGKGERQQLYGLVSTHTYSFLRARGGGKSLALHSAMDCCTWVP